MRFAEHRPVIGVLCFVVVAASLAPIASGQEPIVFDVLIRGGTLYDGRGGPGQRADVGVIGDRIAKVGDLQTARGTTEIDAGGLAVAPGFINMLSWATAGKATSAKA
jgi:N-acyl-D-amino-acid deacylase